MPPSHFQSRLQFSFAQRGERRAGPAAPPPGVVEGGEGVGGDCAFEGLFVRREFDVGAELVRRKRREGDARLEGAAIEMRIFASALEREGDAAEISGVGHVNSGYSDERHAMTPRGFSEGARMKVETSAIVIGAGPAGLMAAETMALAGRSVVVHDASPSPARKFLLAGRGGLNLTHSEPLQTFLEHYGPAADRLLPAIQAFPPDRLRGWAAELGEETFIGSSGRIFPKSFKATPLLRAWLRRLGELGVDFVPRSRFLGFDEDGALRFMAPSGETSVQAASVVFALGGASWPRLGADGFWVEAFRAEGIAVTPLKPANCGFLVDWSPKIRETFAGAPLKTVALSHAEMRVRGEAMVTGAGLEGGAIYALSASLREVIATHGSATITIDFKPDLSEATLAARLKRKPGQSMSTLLRKGAGLTPAAINILREGGPLPEGEALASHVKTCALRLVGTASIARAISTAGGVSWSEIDENFMLRKRPGVFVAGEMIDWEAPTGGYLLQASFATGAAAGRAAARWASK
jgi:uncharacterized flavoprotein (TIGR03862 family)